MSGRIPDAFIDELLARSDIVELIGTRVPLKRAGREYHACCPFHDERTPSFTVSPTKQFYHCFGCGAHGTALKFLMEYDRLEFLDAVEELARRAGIEVPRETSQRARSDFTDLYAVCESAARWFQQQLSNSVRAQQYLGRRGVDADVRQRFAIGYAPDGWDGLRSALGTDPQKLNLLDRAGLLSKNEAGRVYDKFRDRIIFPIHDRRGRVIAFGGRILEKKEDGPKYLNSPETPLFHKGRELYGLWQVRQAHSKIPRLIVVEGYMDVVALWQYGVTTAVATLGTATTPDHAELLFRNAADVYFCFDGDRAGRAAAWKAVESILPRMRDGRQAFFLFLPEGDDPDSLVRREGAAGFDQQLHAALPLSEFFFNEMAHDSNLATLDGRARMAERCKPALTQIPDGAFRDLMQQRLAELTGVGKLRAVAAEPVQPRVNPATAGNARRSLVRPAISMLVQQPSLAELAPPPQPFAHLRQPGVELLLELLQVCHGRPGISTGALLEHFAEREEAAALHKLAMQDLIVPPEHFPEEFRGALRALSHHTLLQRESDLKARLRAPPPDELSVEEKRELVELQMQLRDPRRQAGP